MINIGMDISIHSTGICCEKDGKYLFILIVTSHKKDKILNKLCLLNDVDIIKIERTGDNLTDGKRAGKCAALVIKELQRLWKDNKVNIIKEDFAYSGHRNTLTQLVEYTSLFINAVQCELNCKVDAYAPKHIKKMFSNNGNADKTKMHQKFNTLELEGDFFNFCKQFNEAQPHTNDLIDAFAIVYTLKQELESEREF